MRTFSVGGMNGAATRTAATIRPAAIEAATIAPILRLAVRGGSGWRSLCWVRVIVTASPRDADLYGKARTACASTGRHCRSGALVGAPLTRCAAGFTAPSSESFSPRGCRAVGGLVAPAAQVSHPTPAVGEAPGRARLGAPESDGFASGATTLLARSARWRD